MWKERHQLGPGEHGGQRLLGELLSGQEQVERVSLSLEQLVRAVLVEVGLVQDTEQALAVGLEYEGGLRRHVGGGWEGGQRRGKGGLAGPAEGILHGEVVQADGGEFTMELSRRREDKVGRER